MSFYDLLVIIHVFSAIVGLGPGFIMVYIVTRATTMTELRHAYMIRTRIHVFVMVGGTLLLITGLWMGALRPYLFQQIWYIASLLLFLIALAIGPIVLSPKAKPIKQMLVKIEDEQIPARYYDLAKQLFIYERITNVIFFLIILLMIAKPF